MQLVKEIQCNIAERKVYVLDTEYKPIITFDMGVDFYEGTNGAGQQRGNAEPNVYEEGTDGWVSIDYPNNLEPAYGWAYINIDDRGRALHGGGSNLNDPYAPYQAQLLPTYGCFRMYNADVYWLALAKKQAEANGVDVIIHVV